MNTSCLFALLVVPSVSEHQRRELQNLGAFYVVFTHGVFYVAAFGKRCTKQTAFRERSEFTRLQERAYVLVRRSTTAKEMLASVKGASGEM